MQEAIDQSARNCVYLELDKVLKQARKLLLDFEANPDAAELLDECAAHLGHLCGPLQMLEVQAADLLAREMEQVIDALRQNLLEQPAAALDLMQQALAQLPDYLAGLQAGGRENPALLITLVNSLRAIRSAQPVNISAVFTPDISVPVPVSVYDPSSSASRGDVRRIAREERLRFQTGLLDWFRTGTDAAGLQSLLGVLERLQAGAVREPAARLWWIGAGVVEGLSAGVLQDSPDIKRLFGQIDQQIKYLADRGEAAVSNQLPEELFRGLLFQLACAGAHEGRIDLIKATYRLDECLPPGTDTGAHTEHPGGLRDELQYCASGSDSELSACGIQAEADRRQRHGEVIREVFELMMLAKSALDDCVKSPDDQFLLDPVPGFLSQVQSGLQIMGQQRAADVLEQVEDFITHELMIKRSTLMSDQLDDLADAISSVDCYLEHLGDDCTPAVMMLEIAEGSMQRLGYTRPARATDETGNISVDVEDDRLDSSAGADGKSNQSSQLPTPDEPKGAARTRARAADSGHTLMELAQDIDAVVSETEADELPVLSADADPEIVEIYLEEAAEELEALSRTVPAWLDNPADRDTLEAVRRSFHTLKGSGRMAGAMRAGEFSWSIESLLNKVLDGSVDPDGAVCELLGQVLEPLAQIIRQIGGGPAPDLDVQALLEHAVALASGNGAEPGGNILGEDAVSESEPIESEPIESEPIEAELIDAELIDIFVTECRDLLQLVKDYLVADTAGGVVTEPVYRALHTIAGISETAGATSINLLATDLYSYFDGIYQSHLPVDAGALKVLDECTGAIDCMLVNATALEIDTQRLSALRASIASLPPVAGELPAVVQVTKATGADPAEDIQKPAETHPEAGIMPVAAGAPVVDHDLDEDPYADMDPELVEIFIEEASEILDSSENILRNWTADPHSNGHLDELQRQLHTLKGGARMVNIVAIGDLSHALETLLTQVAEARISTSESLFSLLTDVHDGLAGMLEQVRKRQLPAAAVELMAALGGFGQQDAADPDAVADVADPDAVADAAEADPVADCMPKAGFGTQAMPAIVPRPDCEPESGTGLQAAAGNGPEQPAVEVPAGAVARAAHNAALIGQVMQEGDAVRKNVDRHKISHVRGEQVRVPAGLLDDMVNLAGEITIYRSRIEQQVSDYRFNLNELEQTIGRLHEQLRLMEIETETQILFRFEQDVDRQQTGFDLLEMDRYSNLQQLSRSMIEGISDLLSISELMEGTVRESEVLLLQQSRVNTRLQDGLIRTRMIPFSELAPRLRRVLRQAAQALGKKVDLELAGAEGEIDRTVVGRIIAPLEHMLRNAVAHGIETPEQRLQAGKAETGVVTITMQREGSEIVLCIADDGAGLDLEAIRARALERGLIAPAAELSDNDIMQFILQTGFSTAGEITQISGRGVGMDIVNSEVKQLGGSLQIDSTRGTGMAVTVRLPYTLAVNQALLVKAGEETFCIPVSGIEGVVIIETNDLVSCHEAGDSLDYAGNSYRLQHLGTMLGTGVMETGMGRANYPVLLARTGNKRMAIQVEALLGSREIVIKPLGAQLSMVDGVSGATILGDGRVVLILDLAALALMSAAVQPQGAKEQVRSAGQLVAMVVDDSITVRKVTTRLLERKGFKVLSAKDGVDAIGQLQKYIPDIFLLDVEMPRMDGFELATHIRNDGRLRTIPIVMITSRTGDKHRERARQIGVNRYLGKPYQENDLLDSIYTLMGITAVTASA